MENWKPVFGYEDYYEVSDLGRVRRIERKIRTAIRHNTEKTWPGRILKMNRKRNGYLTVDLCKENRVKTITVHKLVATAFIPNPENKREVNHINCNKTDNRVCNLEWCTSQENKDHAKENGLYESKRKKTVLCKQNGKYFGSSYEAAEWVNNTRYRNSKQVKNIAAKIRAVCLGTQKTAHGYSWEYAANHTEGSSTIP